MAAATDEKKKLEPKADISEVGPCKLKFREGHAPRPLLEKKFGKAVLDDLKFDLLTHSYEEVKESGQVEPLGEPDVDVEKVEVKDNAPFVYEFTVEVKPKVALKSYTGHKVKKAEAAVSDADLEQELTELREEHAQLVPMDGPAAA